MTFDLDVLRTFVVGVELGSFALASKRLGRSRSALSAQLRRLEEQAGAPVFRKSGRGLALTSVGETLLAYARRLLELDDEAAIAVRGVEVEGWVRLGTQEDLGTGLLPDVLRRFARAHPKVRIEARVARNAELLERVKSGSLDLALVWGDASAAPNGERLAQLPMCWIGASEGRAGFQVRAAAARGARGTVSVPPGGGRGARSRACTVATRLLERELGRGLGGCRGGDRLYGPHAARVAARVAGPRHGSAKSARAAVSRLVVAPGRSAACPAVRLLAALAAEAVHDAVAALSFAPAAAQAPAGRDRRSRRALGPARAR